MKEMSKQKNPQMLNLAIIQYIMDLQMCRIDILSESPKIISYALTEKTMNSLLVSVICEQDKQLKISVINQAVTFTRCHIILKSQKKTRFLVLVYGRLCNSWAYPRETETDTQFTVLFLSAERPAFSHKDVLK